MGNLVGMVLRARTKVAPVAWMTPVELRCPKCHSEVVRRSRRSGILERLLSALYLYPFRCERCDHRFTAFRWGTRYGRRRARFLSR